MKNFRTLSILALAIAGAAPAWATYCPTGSVHAGQPEPYWPDRCDEGANPPASQPSINAALGVGKGGNADAAAAAKAKAAAKASATAKTDVRTNVSTKQGQQQQQAQQTQQAQENDQTQNANGNGFNGTIAINAGNNTSSGSSRGIGTVIIPPFIPSNVAPLPSSAIATVQGQCGGQVMVITREVRGRESRTRDTQDFEFTYTSVVRPLTDSNGIPTPFDTTSMPGYVLGHMFVRSTGMAGSSVDASVALNLFGRNGGGGGGVSSGGQLTQMVSEIDVQPCVLASPKPYVAPPRLTFIPTPPPRPPIITHRPRKPRLICK